VATLSFGTATVWLQVLTSPRRGSIALSHNAWSAGPFRMWLSAHELVDSRHTQSRAVTVPKPARKRARVRVTRRSGIQRRDTRLNVPDKLLAIIDRVSGSPARTSLLASSLPMASLPGELDALHAQRHIIHEDRIEAGGGQHDWAHQHPARNVTVTYRPCAIGESATKRYWCGDGFGPAAASYTRSKSVRHVADVLGWLKSRSEECRSVFIS
jgi:hypothetical protein